MANAKTVISDRTWSLLGTSFVLCAMGFLMSVVSETFFFLQSLVDCSQSFEACISTVEVLVNSAGIALVCGSIAGAVYLFTKQHVEPSVTFLGHLIGPKKKT